MRKSVTLLLLLVFLTASSIATPFPVKAKPETIIVPDDYPTIAAAVGNATEGDTILVKKGIYEEKTLEISKTQSLIGENASETTMNLHPPYNVTTIFTQTFTDYANPITIKANNVEISGFTITSDGGEISVTGNRTQIIDNAISTGLSVSGSYNTIAGNSILPLLTLENANSNTISNNTLVSLILGYEYHPCSNNVISGNEMKGPGSFGIYVKAGSNNIFYDNYIADFEGTGGENSGYGVVFSRTNMSEKNTFYHNNFMNNKGTVAFKDGEFVISNFWDNGSEGNYWDDYNGTDSNRDGIGDTPYIINGDNVDRYPLMFPYDIENDTVVLPPPEPFPTVPVAVASVAAIAVVIAGLLVYFKKRKKESGNKA
jgi:nitrous oxidase accessory protein